MKVLIVAANQEHSPDPVVPLGALWIAGALRTAGHDVALYDACFAGHAWERELTQALERSRPDLVGLSIRNVDDVAWPEPTSYLAYYQEVVACLRREVPGVPVVVGGSAFTLMPEAFMAALQPDYGVAGEGEQAVVELARAVSLGRDVPALWRPPPIADLTALPEPALDLADLDAYYQRGGSLNVQTKRGCAFKCEYCTYPMLEGRVVRRRDLRVVVDGLQRLHEERGASHFFVVDNTFNTPPRHALAFCEELARRQLPIGWTCYATPAALGPRLTDAMAAAGCSSVDLGTEAGTEATLRGLGKSFSTRDIVRASKACSAAGLKFSHSLLLGGPGETPDTLRETAELVASTRPTAVVAMFGVRIYPGTGLAARAIAEGRVREGEIGIEPVFYLSREVEDGLLDFARELSTEYGWYVPALVGNRLERYFRRQRERGRKGPLWEMLSKPS